MPEERRLRAVGRDERLVRSPERAPARRARPSGALLAVLVLLVAGLLLAAFDRRELRRRVEMLEAETGALRVELERSDRVIAVQRARLGEVGERVEALRDLLHEPLPGAD